MAKEALRNVVDGSIIDIDTGSSDYRKKRSETYEHEGTIKPLWEITSNAHAERIEQEGPTDHDAGYQNKIGGDVAPAIKKSDLVFGQHRDQLTPAEVKHGIKDPKQKQRELAKMFGTRGGGATTSIDVVNPADRAKRAQAQTGRGQRGGASSGGDGGDGGSGTAASGKGASGAS